MSTEFTITWDGEAPGLAEHRLSLAAFGPALHQLVLAAQRIAGGIVKGGFEWREGRPKGRVPRLAQLLDLQIVDISEGSLKLGIRCTLEPPPNEPVPMFLIDRTAEELMTSLREESQGIARQRVVRKFLKSLPSGVTSQRYALVRNGQEVDVVKIGEAVNAQKQRVSLTHST